MTEPTPQQRRHLAKFTDWQRGSWVNLSNRECMLLVEQGWLEARSVTATGGTGNTQAVFEYRLTQAGLFVLNTATTSGRS